MENTADHHGQEKEWQAHDARFSPNCHAANDLSSLLQGTAAIGKTDSQYGHVPGRQAHEVEWMLRRVVVPPVLIAAWIRECRNSETIEKLVDIVTPDI